MNYVYFSLKKKSRLIPHVLLSFYYIFDYPHIIYIIVITNSCKTLHDVLANLNSNYVTLLPELLLKNEAKRFRPSHFSLHKNNITIRFRQQLFPNALYRKKKKKNILC